MLLFWVIYFAVPVIGFGGLCISDARRVGKAAFRWVHEPQLVIGLLALPAWPLLTLMWVEVEAEERIAAWWYDRKTAST